MRIVKREKQEVSKLFFENNVIILNNNDDIYNKALLMIHKQDYGYLKSYGLRVCYKSDKYKKTNSYDGLYINKKIDLDNYISSGRYLVITATDLFENYINTKIYED